MRALELLKSSQMFKLRGRQSSMESQPPSDSCIFEENDFLLLLT